MSNNNTMTHEGLAALAAATARLSNTWSDFFTKFALTADPYRSQTCANPKCKGPLEPAYLSLVAAARLASLAPPGLYTLDSFAEEIERAQQEEDAPDITIVIPLQPGQDPAKQIMGILDWLFLGR